MDRFIHRIVSKKRSQEKERRNPEAGIITGEEEHTFICFRVPEDDLNYSDVSEEVLEEYLRNE